MTDLAFNNWNGVTDEHIAKCLGDYVRYHRVNQNKSQTILAKEAGMSRSTLSLLERGEAVTLATLIQALRALDRLQAFSGFANNYQQQSPLMLAKAEQKQRQRSYTVAREAGIYNDVEW